MLQPEIIQNYNGSSGPSAHAERSLGRPSMPSLRSRTSPLKFFASSSSTPSAESQRESQQAWQRDYLNELRSYRPTRPVGARPPPKHGDNPLRTTSAMSFRPSLPMRQSSPTRLPEEERCSAAIPHGESASYDPKSSSNSADQSHPADEADATAVQNGPLGHTLQAGMGTRAISSTSRTSSGVYKERGQRLVEKEEARMLREALELVDQQQEARLHSAAQLEASELVWKHQNPEDLSQTIDVPYLYKQPSRFASHVRSQSDVPITKSTELKESHGWVQRSASDHSDEDRGKISKILVPDEDVPNSPQTQTQNTDSTQHEAEAVNDSEKTQSQASHGHALWDSPQKKAYMNLSFTLPQIKLSGRRRSSGSKMRTPSGSLFRNPNDKIYEEPEEMMHGTGKSMSTQTVKPVTCNAMIQNPAARPTNQPPLRSMTDPAENKDKYSRTEDYRNPHSQSRTPMHLRNGLSSTAPKLAGDREQAAQPEVPDAREVRSDDIRAATSKRLKDRSPKLPSPTVVSNTKGRPIVSFDKNWAPSTADTKRQDLSPHRPGSQTCLPLATNRSKPILPDSVASAPIIPTINAPEPPSIHIDEDHSVPSISVSPIPTFSITGAEAPSSSNAEHPKPLRPLPRPRKSIPKPTGRPVPHHSSTAPVHTSLPHWSPSQRRATAQCAACALSISGRIVSAANQRFHPECFTCFHCSEQLECVAFYPEPDTSRTERINRIQARTEGLEVPDEDGKTWEDDGDQSLRFYCHLDYHERFSPRCRSCKTPIEGEVVVACGGQWHVGHFFCAQCGDPFDQKTPFVEKDGYAWCVGCHTNRFSGKCRGCRKPVVDLVVRALGGEWHESCFCCKVRLSAALPHESNQFDSN